MEQISFYVWPMALVGFHNGVFCAATACPLVAQLKVGALFVCLMMSPGAPLDPLERISLKSRFIGGLLDSI